MALENKKTAINAHAEGNSDRCRQRERNSGRYRERERNSKICRHRERNSDRCRQAQRETATDVERETATGGE